MLLNSKTWNCPKDKDLVNRNWTCEHLHRFELCLPDRSIIISRKCASTSAKFMFCQSKASHQSCWSNSRICLLENQQKDWWIGWWEHCITKHSSLRAVLSVGAYRLQTYEGRFIQITPAACGVGDRYATPVLIVELISSGNICVCKECTRFTHFLLLIYYQTLKRENDCLDTLPGSFENLYQPTTFAN